MDYLLISLMKKYIIIRTTMDAKKDTTPKNVRFTLFQLQQICLINHFMVTMPFLQ